MSMDSVSEPPSSAVSGMDSPMYTLSFDWMYYIRLVNNYAVFVLYPHLQASEHMKKWRLSYQSLSFSMQAKLSDV